MLQEKSKTEDVIANRVVFSVGPCVMNVLLNETNAGTAVIQFANDKPRLNRHGLTLIEQLEPGIFSNVEILELQNELGPFETMWNEVQNLVERYELKIRISTCPEFFDANNFEQVRDRLDLLTLNVESHAPEIARQIRPGMDWKQSAKNLGLLATLCRKNSIDCVVNAIWVTETLAVLPETIRFLAELGFDCVNVVPFGGGPDKGRLSDPHVHFSEEYLFRVRQRTIDASREAKIRLQWNSGMSFVSDFRRNSAKLMERNAESGGLPVLHSSENLKYLVPGFCPSVYERVLIDAEGIVKPCPFATKEDLVLGDLRHQSLATIWNDTPAQELRRGMFVGDYPDICQHCHVREPIGRQEDMPFSGMDLYQSEPAIFGKFFSEQEEYHEVRTLFLNSPDHLSRAVESPTLTFHSFYTGAEILLAVAMGGQSDNMMKQRMHVSLDENGDGEFEFPITIWSQMKPNIGYWYAVWQICDDGQPPIRTEWIHCLIRHRDMSKKKVAAGALTPR